VSTVLAAGLVMCWLAVPSASASFSLTFTSCTGTVTTLCYATNEEDVGELFELSGREAASGTSEILGGLFRSTFGAEELLIECTGSAFEGLELVQSEPLVVTPTADASGLHFTGCTVTGFLGKRCKIAKELLSPALIGSFSGPESIWLRSLSGTFLEILFENNGTETCPVTVRGLKKITGEQQCLLSSPSQDQKLHQLECVATGSFLLLNERFVEFEANFATALSTTTDPWSVSSG
jgi:hypothetical protein